MATPVISAIKAREVLDSKGRPMLEVDVIASDGSLGRGASPCGVSVGRHEAFVLRDGGARYGGLGVLTAARNVTEALFPALRGMDVCDQRAVDERLIACDGTPDKSRLGGNALHSVSIASARCGAAARGLPLWRHLGETGGGFVIPRPCFNMVNGGTYGGRSVDVQEHLLIPTDVETFAEALRVGAEVFYRLPEAIGKRFGAGAVAPGHSVGYAAPVNDPAAIIETMLEAARLAGHEGRVAFGLDVAASHFFSPERGLYAFRGRETDRAGMIAYLSELTETCGLCLIEDPLDEDDFEGFAAITQRLPGVLVAGDDLFVTNRERIERGATLGAGNAVVVKPNMVGTITEALDAAAFAKANGYALIPGGRAGGAVDDPITELAVVMGAELAKFGGPRAGEKTNKYNGLLRIEEELGGGARLAPFPAPQREPPHAR